MIHDVSTDALDPPPFVALLAARLRCKNGAHYSGLAASAQALRYPDIAPLQFAEPTATVFASAVKTVEALGWALAAAVESEGRIEATATTRLMRFKDDVVIRLCPSSAAGGTRLDIRSASRVGSSDLGANAKRIRRFVRELKNRYKSTT